MVQWQYGSNMAQQFDDFLIRLKSRMAKSGGDLPIFSASGQRLRLVSANPNSSAMTLAMEAMKDANLSTKLLRLANSPYYNRRGIGIGTISQAVMLLGFDTVMNLSLTLRMVESFQQENPEIDMNGMLVTALLSAGFVRDLALECGHNNPEESYVCALMHNLGQIVVANFMPEDYGEIQRLKDSEGMNWLEAQSQVMGGNLTEVGKRIARAWEFPGAVVQTMERFDPGTDPRVKNESDLNHALASLSGQVFGSVYSVNNDDRYKVDDIMDSLVKVTGLKEKKLQEQLSDTFRGTCDIAEQYGLKKEIFTPSIETSDDETRDAFVRKFSYYTSTMKQEPPQETATEEVPVDEKQPQASVNKEATAAVERTPPKAVEASGPETSQKRSAEKSPQVSLETAVAAPVADTATSSLELQLNYMREITEMITKKFGANKVFVRVLAAITEAIGFDRAVLCLVSADHKQLVGRIAVGKDGERLKESFNVALKGSTNIFSSTVLKGNEVIVADVNDASWNNQIPKNFLNSAETNGFVIAALMAGEKPVGLFYADNSSSQREVTPDTYSGFMQFVNQARIALSVI